MTKSEPIVRELSCFNAYDVRGKIDTEFDGDVCYRIGISFSKVLKASCVVVGYDARLSSHKLAQSLVKGLNDEGTKVLYLGLCGTEEMYFATSHFDADGGIIVTGSHNPIDYNGLKMVKSKSRPLDQENEFFEIKRVAERLDQLSINPKERNVKDISSLNRSAYCSKIISFVDDCTFRPLKIVVNFGNGAAGPTYDSIVKQGAFKTKKLKFIKLFYKPDGTFPNGIPNPMILENQIITSNAVLREGADLGIAFDGDFDRCFFFDEKGKFVSGEHIIGLLASTFLNKEAEATIVHDPRIIWNIEDIVKKLNGKCVQSRTGHAFIKKSMRQHNAIYGGEISAHHYFRDFFFCDSGMVPWLLVCSMMSQAEQSLSLLVGAQVSAFPSSGEHNFIVNDTKEMIEFISNYYKKDQASIDTTDGVSISMKNWRMNLRASNTEPLLRLNIESIANKQLVVEKLKEVTHLIKINLGKV